MKENLVYEKIAYKNTFIQASVMTPEIKIFKTLYLLHGGGKSASMERFLQLRLKLLTMDIETISFDFIGHGLTNGDLYETSLYDCK
jgi:hypothetical protein